MPWRPFTKYQLQKWSKAQKRNFYNSASKWNMLSILSYIWFTNILLHILMSKTPHNGSKLCFFLFFFCILKVPQVVTKLLIIQRHCNNFMAEITGQDYQPCWISDTWLNSKLFVTSLIGLIALMSTCIFTVCFANLWQLESSFWLFAIHSQLWHVLPTCHYQNYHLP